jgi:hypothetical protein
MRRSATKRMEWGSRRRSLCTAKRKSSSRCSTPRKTECPGRLAYSPTLERERVDFAAAPAAADVDDDDDEGACLGGDLDDGLDDTGSAGPGDDAALDAPPGRMFDIAIAVIRREGEGRGATEPS